MPDVQKSWGSGGDEDENFLEVMLQMATETLIFTCGSWGAIEGPEIEQQSNPNVCFTMITLESLEWQELMGKGYI